MSRERIQDSIKINVYFCFSPSFPGENPKKDVEVEVQTINLKAEPEISFPKKIKALLCGIILEWPRSTRVRMQLASAVEIQSVGHWLCPP